MIAQLNGSQNRATEKQRSNLLKTAVKLTRNSTLGSQIMYITNVTNILTYLYLGKKKKLTYYLVISHVLHHCRGEMRICLPPGSYSELIC